MFLPYHKGRLAISIPHTHHGAYKKVPLIRRPPTTVLTFFLFSSGGTQRGIFRKTFRMAFYCFFFLMFIQINHFESLRRIFQRQERRLGKGILSLNFLSPLSFRNSYPDFGCIQNDSFFLKKEKALKFLMLRKFETMFY